MPNSNEFSRLPGRLECFRNAVALAPQYADPDPGLVVMVFRDDQTPSLSCDCRRGRAKKKCPHTGELAAHLRKSTGAAAPDRFDETFRKGPLYRLAGILNDTCPVDARKLSFENGNAAPDDRKTVRVLRPDGNLAVAYYPDADPAAGDPALAPGLFGERARITPDGDDPHHRGRILEILSSLTMTPSERVMRQSGMKSRRQAMEESFWYRVAYHFLMAHGWNGAAIHPEIDVTTGCFSIRCRVGESVILDIAVPRDATTRVLKSLEGEFKGGRIPQIWTDSLESIVRIEADANNDLILILYFLLHRPDGVTEAIERRSLKNFWHRDAVYLPGKEVLATVRKPDRFGEVFGGSFRKKIKRNRLPEVIEKLGDIFSPPNIIDDSAQRLRIHREFDRIEVDSSAIDRDWCWLSVHYGFSDDIRVSLKDIYKAKISLNRYIPVDDGWVDSWAIDIAPLTRAPGNSITDQLAAGKDELKLSRIDLLRLLAFEKPVSIAPGSRADSGRLASILEMRPRAPLGEIKGLTSTLRDYQRQGVEWLAFLHENRFGGLLCDEMGLGKTHQVMGLMAWLTEEKRGKSLFLVVCPTTVISHWGRKIREHAPLLHPVIYHGAERELDGVDSPGTVVITSYGILLRDIDRLGGFRFSMAAFDEAQHIKNPSVKSHAAAAAIQADLKIMVTGTPVENRLMDLKALMNIALPGYLGTDDHFQRRYESDSRQHRGELRRIVRPFTMRRMKSAVLSELPEKIEDIRYCRLTDAQVRLYRQAISGRGKGLLRQLEHDDDIPYIHIFALLTLLKQICNHPGSIRRDHPEPMAGPSDSGKWELFVELLEACLENDQKIVVFSQFIPMIEIIMAHLKETGIGAACLTGQTRKREKEIDRFNDDPHCRVFVGSLKAGGSGIDLIGGSVVIHYDRWWNAAKEDQATDRVHRIGQTRGVQVFKLVTEGTLEEKIAAIIDRKKRLMQDVIAEDDPGLLKTFTREELIDLIAMPA